MPQTIFVPLLNEGTPVWRPAKGEPLGNGRYRLYGEVPDDEEWAFAPGAIVVVDEGLRVVAEDGR